MLIYLITGDVNLDHWSRRCLLGFSTVKLPASPFVINKELGGDTWKRCKYLVSLQTFAYWCEHSWVDLACNSYYCGVGLMGFILISYKVNEACPRLQKPWPSSAQNPATASISLRGKAKALMRVPQIPPIWPPWGPWLYWYPTLPPSLALGHGGFLAVPWKYCQVWTFALATRTAWNTLNPISHYICMYANRCSVNPPSSNLHEDREPVCFDYCCMPSV